MVKKISVALVICAFFLGSTPALAQDNGKPPVEELEKKFNAFFELETNQDGQVEKYDSKARLEQELKGIMVWPLADHYLDTYFEEKNGALYMKEIDGPVKLQTGKDYTLEKISDTKYTLTQQGQNELRGEYTLEIDYSYEAGRWVFADRMNVVSSDGGQLPDTATTLPNILMIGILMMVSGVVVLFVRKRSTV